MAARNIGLWEGRSIFHVFVEAQRYADLAYLILNLIWGVLIFSFFITMYCLGIGLAVIGIGIPIFIWTMWLARLTCGVDARFGRFMISSLDKETPCRRPEPQRMFMQTYPDQLPVPDTTLIAKVKTLLTLPSTYLANSNTFIFKFVLSLLGGVVGITLWATAVTYMFYYPLLEAGVLPDYENSLDDDVFNTWKRRALVTVVAWILYPIFMLCITLLAHVQGLIACEIGDHMLDNSEYSYLPYKYCANMMLLPNRVVIPSGYYVAVPMAPSMPLLAPVPPAGPPPPHYPYSPPPSINGSTSSYDSKPRTSSTTSSHTSNPAPLYPMTMQTLNTIEQPNSMEIDTVQMQPIDHV